MRIAGFVLLLALVISVSSCGGGSSSPERGATSVVVTPSTTTVLRGETQQFTAQVSGQANQNVTWSVPPNLGSISPSGLYTAPSGSDGGPAVFVRATSKVVPSASGTAVVVRPTIPFSITPPSLAIAPGANRTFVATVVGLNSSSVEWSIQGTAGGTITNGGLYTASSTTGIDYVVATASANRNYSATALVLVTTPGTSFSPTGSLQNGREFHTATLLRNGTVLVAGGGNPDGYCLAGIASAELYDSNAGAFASTGTMTTGRYGHTSTLLPDGEVLMTGGFSSVSDCPNAGLTPAESSAELYDPSNGSFALTGSMAENRGGHTATLLLDGRVLIAGGGKMGGDQPAFYGDGSATAEIYDPATRAFTSTGRMVTPRLGQTATLLDNGKVLVTGGITSSSAITTAELYDPTAGIFTPTGSMASARAGHTATQLQDGRVLITGGLSGVIQLTQAGSDTAEIYDPATGSFSATGSMAVTRELHTATLLPDGTVLVVGGGSRTAEIYSPSAGSFYFFGLTVSERSGHSATLLPNGIVIVGGVGSHSISFSYGVTTAELSQ